MAENNTPMQNLSLVRSNEMISAKYKSSLLENQVMAIALSRIEVNTEDKENPLVAKFYPGELKRLVSDPKHIYRDLKNLATTITGHTMFLEDGKGNFKAFSIVPNADYIDGVFVIRFNNEIKNHIYGLEKNFTKMELGLLTDFESNASFRIYELLKKEIYKSKPTVNDGRVDVEYNLFEFKFMIGLANSDNQSVKAAISRMGDEIDWAKLYDMLDKKDKKYAKPVDLKKYVLEPAKEELEEKSDIRFEFEFAASHGRKVDIIVFHCWPQEIKNNKRALERAEYISKIGEPFRQNEMPMDQFPELYNDLVGHNALSIEDISLLLKYSEYDETMIREAVEAADQQDYLTNYMGWLVSYIKNGGYQKTETIKGDNDQAKKVKNIMEEVNNNQSTIAKRVWEKAKGNEDFPEFLAACNVNTVEELELVYGEATETFQLYIDWKKEKNKNY